MTASARLGEQRVCRGDRFASRLRAFTEYREAATALRSKSRTRDPFFFPFADLDRGEACWERAARNRRTPDRSNLERHPTAWCARLGLATQMRVRDLSCS